MTEFNKDYEKYYKSIEKIISRKKNKFKQELLLEQAKTALLRHQEETNNISRLQSHQKFVDSIESAIKEEHINQKKQKIQDNYVGSGMFLTMSYYIDLLFVKNIFMGKYIINYYVDAFIAFLALLVAVTQLSKQYQIIKKYNLKLKPWLIEALGLAVALFVMIFTYNSPFDITFVIIVVAMIANKRLFIKQWNS